MALAGPAWGQPAAPGDPSTPVEPALPPPAPVEPAVLPPAPAAARTEPTSRSALPILFAGLAGSALGTAAGLLLAPGLGCSDSREIDDDGHTEGSFCPLAAALLIGTAGAIVGPALTVPLVGVWLGRDGTVVGAILGVLAGTAVGAVVLVIAANQGSLVLALPALAAPGIGAAVGYLSSEPDLPPTRASLLSLHRDAAVTLCMPALMPVIDADRRLGASVSLLAGTF